MAEYFRVLKYPLLVWFLLDTVSVGATAFVPGLINISDSFTGSTIWTVALGAVAGYKMIELKGNWFHAMVAGLITGVWCAVLAVTEIGIVSVPPSAMGLNLLAFAFAHQIGALLPIGFAFFILNVIGAVIGAGFALTRRTS